MLGLSRARTFHKRWPTPVTTKGSPAPVASTSLRLPYAQHPPYLLHVEGCSPTRLRLTYRLPLCRLSCGIGTRLNSSTRLLPHAPFSLHRKAVLSQLAHVICAISASDPRSRQGIAPAAYIYIPKSSTPNSPLVSWSSRKVRSSRQTAPHARVNSGISPISVTSPVSSLTYLTLQRRRTDSTFLSWSPAVKISLACVMPRLCLGVSAWPVWGLI